MRDSTSFNRNDHHTSVARASFTSGFTLVELLFAMLIIAILVSVLFPTFLFVRENGRRTACLSNEKQLGMALLQYTSDHDENWPSGIPIVTSTGAVIGQAGAGWAGECYPYLKSAKVFRCPDDAPLPYYFPKNEVPISYGYNSNITLSSHTRHVAYLAGAAKTVLLFEVSQSGAALTSPVPEISSASGEGGQCRGSGGGPLAATYPCGEVNGDTFPLYATGNMGGRILNGGEGSTPRHRGGADYLACDGHVGWLRPSEVSSGISWGYPAAPQTEFGAAGTGNPLYKITFNLH